MNGDEQAFPSDVEQFKSSGETFMNKCSGLTKREYIATAVLTALSTRQVGYTTLARTEICDEAIKLTDALLSRLESLCEPQEGK